MKEYTIKNEQLSLTVLEYGARIHKLQYNDHFGSQNLVHSLHETSKYRDDTTSLNAVIGRFAGRICSSQIILDQKKYTLPTNDGVHLHGGIGFANRLWKVDALSHKETPKIQLSYTSTHLEDGYPGTLKVVVTYILKKNSLIVDFKATTDQTTLVNLTQHTYFKLDDQMKFNHLQFKIPASAILETENNLCPTGDLIPLNEKAQHPLNFNKEHALGTNEFDTPYVIDSSKAIEVYSPKSKLRLVTTTNQPIAVLYTPSSRVGFCVETQNYPNSPNCKNFPSAELKPGEMYNSHTQYKFLRD